MLSPDLESAVVDAVGVLHLNSRQLLGILHIEDGAAVGIHNARAVEEEGGGVVLRQLFLDDLALLGGKVDAVDEDIELVFKDTMNVQLEKYKDKLKDEGRCIRHLPFVYLFSGKLRRLF